AGAAGSPQMERAAVPLMERRRPLGSAKPRARTAELVVEDVGDELLIYDLRSDEAHCLDPRAAAVWRACDGKAPVANIAAATGMAEDAVEQTLRELSALSLVEAPLDHSRRDAMKLVLTAAAAIPAVRTIAVPIAGVA